MSRFFRCTQFVYVVAVLLLATAAWADGVIQVTSQAGLSPDSSISWTQLGGDQTQVPASFSVNSSKSLSTTVTLTGAKSVVSVVCAAAPPLSTNCSWNGAGFTAGDSLLWAVNAYTGGNGPLTLAFASGVKGAGTFVQSDVPGQFTASIQAFNGSSSLGTFTETSDAAGDAIYLGVLDNTAANITSVVYSLTACASSCNDFAVDAVDLATVAAAADFSLSASPNTVTVVQGSSNTTTITITPVNGFTGSVTLSASGLPSGVTAGFSPNPATSSSTLTLTASSTATTGTVTVTVTGVSSSLTHSTTFSLTVNPSGAGAVTLNPTSLTWGNIQVGKTGAKKTVTMTNSGTATLHISNIQASGDFALVTSTKPCGSTLAVGANCLISATFTPTQAGVRNGDITITDDAGDSPQQVSLTGTGTGSSGKVTLTPTSATFPKTKVGHGSTATSFTLSNAQNVALANIMISINGDFSVTGTSCHSTLAAQSRCTISVIFQPTQTGLRTGLLRVSDNAAGAPQTSSLSGTGK